MTHWQSLTCKQPNFDQGALHIWARRLRGELGKALQILDPKFHSVSITENDGMKKWFNYGAQSHALHLPPKNWLWLSETQVMAGLAHFTKELGQPAHVALANALSPKLDLKDCTPDQCETEVRVKKSDSRIDLLLSGHRDGRAFCIVVEAKLGSTLASNPLPAYRRHAESVAELSSGDFEFVVIDFGTCPKTEERLKRNGSWKLLSWFVFLSRLEKELVRSGVNDPEYAEFRRAVWWRV